MVSTLLTNSITQDLNMFLNRNITHNLNIMHNLNITHNLSTPSPKLPMPPMLLLLKPPPKATTPLVAAIGAVPSFSSPIWSR